MQLTLVSHYGEKPAEFARLINELQSWIAELLGDRFHPYEPKQVHATIVGLEGARAGDSIYNENFLQYRGEKRVVDFAGLMSFVRHEFIGTDIQIGGFRADADCGFMSQGQSPFVRSFSLQNEIAVAMGWPMLDGASSNALDELRRHMQKFGVLHKWHRHASAVDNDFFFVLGRIPSTLLETERAAVESELRARLSRRKPSLLALHRDTLAFVAYSDSRLPVASSRIFRLTAPQVTAEVLANIYRA